MSKKATKHLKHSLKHHVPTSIGGFVLGIIWAVDTAKDAISGLAKDSETIQECIEIIESAIPI